MIAAVVACAAAACNKGKASSAEDCLVGKADFVKGFRDSFASRIAAMPPSEQGRAREFFEKKAAFAETHYETYCKSVSDADWACVHKVIESDSAPGPDCRPALDRLMKAVADESDPDYK